MIKRMGRARTQLDVALRRLARRAHDLNRARKRRGLVIPIGFSTPASRLLVLLLAMLGALSGALVWGLGYLTPVTPGREIRLTELLTLAANQQVQTATFYDADHRVTGTFLVTPPPLAKAAAPASGSVPSPATTTTPVHSPRPTTGTYWAAVPPSDVETPFLIDKLAAGGALVDVHHQADKAIVQFLVQYLVPLAILANLFGLILVVARYGGGDSLRGVIQFGRIGKRRGGARPQTRITFADVAGADEAMAELREVRDYLSDPERFTMLGAQPPKGVLLFGPPGCGKTLMARAVAGEAGVPFFSISGAEFVESLVGIGAARVRDLFKQVREAAPAIVFIDELDAAGRRRGGITGGQEEREQTLNQLLVEMDGFEPTAGIVVMGATNRPDILDPALLRPGRFDRQVTVDTPDLAGRQAILALHARGRPLAPDVDFEYLARRTPGFTGADLANVINEGALLSVRFGRSAIGREELEEAVQRVLVGPQRRGHLLSADERRRAAYHEAGHALVAAAMGRPDHLQRVSIVARGRTLGAVTVSKSWQERMLLSRSELRSEMVIVIAGVAAEELVLGEPSTGGENDLERATALAEMMAGRYGMTERIGKVRLVRVDGNEFLGEETIPRELTAGPVLMELHQEVRRQLEDAESAAIDILVRHRSLLTEVAGRLEREETLETEQLESMLESVRPEMNLIAADVLEPSHRNGAAMPGSTVRH